MKISTKGRYGLRLLVDIGLNSVEGGVIPMKDIAERQGISVKYLWQIMNPLQKAGIISSSRGVYGGFALARDPADVTLLEILATLEGSMTLVDCLLEKDACDRKKTCMTHSIWAEINDRIRQELHRVTLADILRRCEALT